MKTNQKQTNLRNLILASLFSLLILSCGSFQSSSYYSTDGIYNSPTESKSVLQSKKTTSNSNYYEEYFKSVAKEGYAESTSNNIYFTDTDRYTSTKQSSDTDKMVENSQLPWGENLTQREVVFDNYSPNFMWGLSNFAFNYSPFWNSYYSNPYSFRFGFTNFYNPLFNSPYLNPYRGYMGFMGGFDPFFSSFNYYPGLYYDSYGFRFGFHNGFNNRWGYPYNRWNRFADYYGMNFRNRNDLDYLSTVSRVKSGRGERNYNNSISRTESNAQDNNVKSRNVKNTLSRINKGRGVSLGKTALLKYNPNRLATAQRVYSDIRNVRPGLNVNSTERNINIIRRNNNITKSKQRVSESTSRYPNRNELDKRNPNQKQNSTSQSLINTNVRENNIRVQRSEYNRSERSYRNNSSYSGSNNSPTRRSSFGTGGRSSYGNNNSSSTSRGRRN